MKPEGWSAQQYHHQLHQLGKQHTDTDFVADFSNVNIIVNAKQVTTTMTTTTANIRMNVSNHRQLNNEISSENGNGLIPNRHRNGNGDSSRYLPVFIGAKFSDTTLKDLDDQFWETKSGGPDTTTTRRGAHFGDCKPDQQLTSRKARRGH